MKSRRLFIAILAAFVALAMATPYAQPLATRQATERVRAALERLPSYGVFDFLGFELDVRRADLSGPPKGIVMLRGYAYSGSLKSDAGSALRKVGGIDEIGNNIEVLPASSNDDRIRVQTFYNIYADSFLSRYAPGGPANVYHDAVRFIRFPGVQPFGHYPIHIVVKHGRTKLLGVVDNESDKMIAGVRAREIQGVFGVENELVVESD
jgi:hypothetical protein